jgi:hypothetical protein
MEELARLRKLVDQASPLPRRFADISMEYDIKYELHHNQADKDMANRYLDAMTHADRRVWRRWRVWSALARQYRSAGVQ